MWVALVLSLGYAGLSALDKVTDDAARTVLGLFYLLGMGALLVLMQRSTSDIRKLRGDWAWEKRMHKLLRSPRSRTPPDRP